MVQTKQHACFGWIQTKYQGVTQHLTAWEKNPQKPNWDLEATLANKPAQQDSPGSGIHLRFPDCICWVRLTELQPDTSSSSQWNHKEELVTTQTAYPAMKSFWHDRLLNRQIHGCCSFIKAQQHSNSELQQMAKTTGNVSKKKNKFEKNLANWNLKLRTGYLDVFFLVCIFAYFWNSVLTLDIIQNTKYGQ